MYTVTLQRPEGLDRVGIPPALSNMEGREVVVVHQGLAYVGPWVDGAYLNVRPMPSVLVVLL